MDTDDDSSMDCCDPYDGSFPAVGETLQNTGCTGAHQALLTVLPPQTRREEKDERAEYRRTVEQEAARFGIQPRREKKWKRRHKVVIDVLNNME